jgi:hypothetical protein
MLEHAPNAFEILGQVQRTLRAADYSEEEIDPVLDHMTAGDYNHLLDIASKYITVSVEWYEA